MAKKDRIPVRVERLCESLSKGRVVCLTVRNTDTDNDRLYSIETGGKTVGNWTVDRALDLGLIEPVGDGLFPEAASQTYRLVL